MGTLNTWVFWLKQISETSSFHSFWFKLEGVNHLKIETHLIPVRENPPKHPWKLRILAWQFCWWKRWSFQRWSEVTSSNRVGDFFKVKSTHESTPRKLETPIRVFFPNAKKTPPRCWHSTPTFDVFSRLRVIASCSFWWGSFIWIPRSVGRRTKRCCTPSSTTRLVAELWRVSKGWKNQRHLKIIERPCSGDKTFWMIHTPGFTKHLFFPGIFVGF